MTDLFRYNRNTPQKRCPRAVLVRKQYQKRLQKAIDWLTLANRGTITENPGSRPNGGNWRRHRNGRRKEDKRGEDSTYTDDSNGPKGTTHRTLPYRVERDTHYWVEKGRKCKGDRLREH